MLEIGTGWGELAIHAARRGATVHTITLSTEQKALAEHRIAEAGLSDRVTVELLDYRELVTGDSPHLGAYDAVLSVEMIEAVGYDFWDDYFRILDRVLAPGGRVGIQAITMRHDRMLATRNTYTWINKYIFPGGFLPSVEVIDEITRRHTSLRIADRLSFGSHYAETLRQWDERFLAARDAGAGARLRRHVRADVALLPGLLAGRLRLGLHRRATRSCSSEETGHDRLVSGRRTTPAGVAADARRGRGSPSSAATCRSDCAPGTAPRPARRRRRVVEVRSPDALRRLLWHPGELGAAQAYVTGELDVPGDLEQALTHAVAVGRLRGLAGRRPGAAAWLAAYACSGSWASSDLRRPRRRRRPAPRGRLHSPRRDRQAISHHYDLSNEFYALVLDPLDGLLVRLLRRRPGAVGRVGAAGEARPGLHQARPRARAARCSTSGAAGARCRCTPPSTSAPGWSA